MTTARKKSPSRKRSASSAPRSRSGAGKARRRPAFFRVFLFLLVLALAAFGGHNALLRWVPGYSVWAEKAGVALRRVWDDLSRAGNRAVDAVKPAPTITIRGPDDLGKTPYDNLSVGVPGWQCDVILDRNGYALGFRDQWKQPVWVSYKLTADEVRSKKAKRSDDFRSDPAIPNGSATPEDYRGSHYDRGHLAPAADMTWSLQAMSESFYLSNMSPQSADCNRGIWKQLESQVRDFALKHGEVYVVTGPVFLPNRPVVTVGAGRVAVPHAYYKVVLAVKPPHSKAIGFIVPNSGSRRPLADFAVTVDAVEQATGLDFFNKLDPAVERRVERECDYRSWH